MEPSKADLDMVLESITSQMEISMRECGMRIRDTEKVSITIAMERSTEAIIS